MKIKQLSDKLLEFIEFEIIPEATPIEKAVFIGAPIFGIFDLEIAIRNALGNDIFKGSKVWLNESEGEVSITVLKQFANKYLSALGGSFVFQGITKTLGKTNITLFKGYEIDEVVIAKLFSHLEAK